MSPMIVQTLPLYNPEDTIQYVRQLREAITGNFGASATDGKTPWIEITYTPGRSGGIKGDREAGLIIHVRRPKQVPAVTAILQRVFAQAFPNDVTTVSVLNPGATTVTPSFGVIGGGRDE